MGLIDTSEDTFMQVRPDDTVTVIIKHIEPSLILPKTTLRIQALLNNRLDSGSRPKSGLARNDGN